MKIPDYISPLVGWRTWKWDGAGLRSLNGELWVPGQPLESNCKRNDLAAVLRKMLIRHMPPHKACKCGIYAAKNVEHLLNIGFMRYGDVHGEVYLWGKVWDHRFGYRAQYAYPKTFVLPPHLIPEADELVSGLKSLVAYQADIFIVAPPQDIADPTAVPQQDIPLWTRASGYDQAGLNWIAERHRWKCWCGEKEQSLRAGDRVAVACKGTCVVEHVDERSVRLVMRNKLALELPRNQVKWFPLGFVADG